MNKMERINFEFVLVNDCSPDNGATITKLQELASAYSYVKVVELHLRLLVLGLNILSVKPAVTDII